MKSLTAVLIMAAGVCIGAPGNGMQPVAPGGAQPMPPQGRMPQSPNGGRVVAHPSSRQGTMSSRRNPGQSRGRRADSDELPEAEQKLVEQLEEADSMKAISRLSQRAMSSRHVEVRQAMVDALERQGEDAVNELAPYMADTDKDVADSAFTAWAGILDGMSRNRRIQAINAAAGVLGSAGMHGGRAPGSVMPGNSQRPGELPVHGNGQRVR